MPPHPRRLNPFYFRAGLLPGPDWEYRLQHGS